MVRPATSTAAAFQAPCEQVESTVKTFWPKDRGVVEKVSGTAFREVVTTKDSVVVLRPSQLKPTTLTEEEAGLCAATLERLRSSTKDYVQARIDGTIVFRDNDGRQIRNSFEGVEDGETLRQFEVRETDVRCTLCRDARTWPLDTDTHQDFERHQRALSCRWGRATGERSPRGQGIWRLWRTLTTLAPVAARCSCSHQWRRPSSRNAVLQLEAGAAIPGGLLSGPGRGRHQAGSSSTESAQADNAY